MLLLAFGKGETGCILATCGGNTVCFIDVHSGLVMMRFKDTDDVEVTCSNMIGSVPCTMFVVSFYNDVVYIL